MAAISWRRAIPPVIFIILMTSAFQNCSDTSLSHNQAASACQIVVPNLCPISEGYCTTCAANNTISRYKALQKALVARGLSGCPATTNPFPGDVVCTGAPTDDPVLCSGTPSMAACVELGGTNLGSGAVAISNGSGINVSNGLENFGWGAIERRHALMFAFRAEFETCGSTLAAQILALENAPVVAPATGPNRHMVFSTWIQDVQSGDNTWWPDEFIAWALGVTTFNNLAKGNLLLANLPETPVSEFDGYISQWQNILSSQPSCSVLTNQVLNFNYATTAGGAPLGTNN